MNSSDQLVDFLIIGAAKSGTTSLFSYLREHPDIYLPMEKEVCFFSNNAKYANGLGWYLKEYFPDVKTRGKTTGEATPAYMLYEHAMRRIHEHTPGSKLIAILRNPIYRAYSHYIFAKRLSIENGSFSEALDTLVRRGSVSDEKIVNENREYLMFGEYGRTLGRYLDCFPKNNIKIVFFEDLKRDPYSTMAKVFSFLGVDTSFRTEKFEKVHNVSGQARFKSVLRLQNWLKDNRTVRRAILKLFPADLVGGIDQWILRKGNLKKIEYEGPTKSEIERLEEYYRDDVRLLVQLFEVVPPWPEFVAQSDKGKLLR